MAARVGDLCGGARLHRGREPILEAERGGVFSGERARLGTHVEAGARGRSSRAKERQTDRAASAANVEHPKVAWLWAGGGPRDDVLDELLGLGTGNEYGWRHLRTVRSCCAPWCSRNYGDVAMPGE